MMRRHPIARATGMAALAVVLITSACSSSGSDTPTPSPTQSTTSPTPVASMTPAEFYEGFKAAADPIITNAQGQSSPPTSAELKTQATAVENLIKFTATSTVPADAADLVNTVEANASLYLKTAEDLENADLELETIEKQEQALQTLQDAQAQLINSIENVYNSAQFKDAT